MEPSDRVLILITEALDAIETGSQPLSEAIRKSIRIARLRNDYLNLWWLEWELSDFSNKLRRDQIVVEVSPHFTKEACKRNSEIFYDIWVDERGCVNINERGEIVSDEMIVAKSVAEIEMDIANLEEIASLPQPPSGLHPSDLYLVEQSRSKQRSMALAISHSRRAVLERIKHRVHRFLSQSEKQLVFGQLHADIFEQYRQYVDLKLGQLCPEALEKFVAAYQRMQEDTPESRAQALVSCRRLLKSLADVLFPPPSTPVVGADGISRVLTDEKYVARLWQYAFDRIGRSASGELLLSQVNDLGNRIDRLYDLTNKGVHAEVSRFEVNQCVIQTYLLIGDLIRIAEKQSAIGNEEA
jgi:hypothetical protein